MACGCCCDLCNEDRLVCDKCCKCVPKAFCAKFTPNDLDDCGERSAYMERKESYDAENDYTLSTYAGLGVVITLEYDSYEGSCFWHVVSEDNDFDERYPIRDYGFGCRAPEFSVPVIDPYCPGTITITRYELEKAPFVQEYGDECWDFYCGNCRCACKTLCVFIIEAGQPPQVEDWEWNGHGWGEAILSRDEYTGDCVLTYQDYDPVTLGGCGNDVSFTLDDGYTRIVATCKRCNCELWVSCACPAPLPCTIYLTVEAFGESHNPMSPPVDGSCNNGVFPMTCIPVTQDAGEPHAQWEGEWNPWPCCGDGEFRYRQLCLGGIMALFMDRRGEQFEFTELVVTTNQQVAQSCDPYMFTWERVNWGSYQCGADGFAWVRWTVSE